MVPLTLAASTLEPGNMTLSCSCSESMSNPTFTSTTCDRSSSSHTTNCVVPGFLAVTRMVEGPTRFTSAISGCAMLTRLNGALVATSVLLLIISATEPVASTPLATSEPVDALAAAGGSVPGAIGVAAAAGTSPASGEPAPATGTV